MTGARGLLGPVAPGAESADILTDWYPMSIKPVRIGWYDMRFWIRDRAEFSGPCRRHWDGRRWSYSTHGQRPIVITPDDQWRGCADEPKTPRLTDRKLKS